MPVIVIQNLRNKKIEFSDRNLTILKILHDSGVDWMHSCGGKGNCTSCKVQVLKGAQNLNQITVPEKDYLKMRLLKKHERLACQCKAKSNLIIRAPEEFKLSHIKYSE